MAKHGIHIKFGGGKPPEDGETPVPVNENSMLREESGIITVHPKGINARESVPEIVASVRGLINHPPVIREIQNPDDETAMEIPQVLQIILPTDAEKIKNYLTAAKCENFERLMKRLEAVAEDEELMIDFIPGKEVWVIEISQNPDIQYSKPLDPQNAELLFFFPHRKLSFNQKMIR